MRRGLHSISVDIVAIFERSANIVLDILRQFHNNLLILSKLANCPLLTITIEHYLQLSISRKDGKTIKGLREKKRLQMKTQWRNQRGFGWSEPSASRLGAPLQCREVPRLAAGINQPTVSSNFQVWTPQSHFFFTTPGVLQLVDPLPVRASWLTLGEPLTLEL